MRSKALGDRRLRGSLSAVPTRFVVRYVAARKRARPQAARIPGAPQSQACSPSQGRPGWLSQTQSQSSQSVHFIRAELPCRRHAL
jgi:hypothetical protein